MPLLHWSQSFADAHCPFLGFDLWSLAFPKSKAQCEEMEKNRLISF
jgi:hypothetical protein